jgi:hypothetical protein
VRKEPVEQRRTSIAYMQLAGGRWCKADAHFQ